jgi:hypothetical protein
MTVAVETMPVQDMGEIMNGAGSEHQRCLEQWCKLVIFHQFLALVCINGQ